MSESSPAYREFVDALRERLDVIADRDWYQRDPAGHLARLKDVSERIAALGANLPTPVDPQLTHYLQRSSYDKALAFAEGIAGPHSKV